MSIYINELRRFLFRHKLLAALLILECTVCTTVLSILFANTHLMFGISSMFQNNLGDKEYYYVYDDIDANEEYEKLFEKDNILEILSDYMQELREQDSFDFVNMHSQAIRIENVTFDEKFNDETCIPMYNEQYLKTYQVSETFFSVFQLKTESGQLFSREDYVLEEGKPIPVILGSAYKGVLKIGDTFAGDHSLGTFTFQVIDFLTPNAIVTDLSDIVCIDRHVLLPAFTKFDTENYYSYAIYGLLHQTNGYIIADRKDMNIQKYIDSLTEKYDLIPFIVQHNTGDGIQQVSSLSGETVQQLFFFGISIFAFASLAIGFCLYCRFREDYKIYATHLICGAGTENIKKIISFELLFLIFCSQLLFWIAAAILSLFSVSVSVKFGIALGIAIYVFAGMAPKKAINSKNINKMLRRED